MIELSIPQPGETSKQAKDLVFTILTKEKALSLIQLYNEIKKNYNVSITYQAVRKAVELMVEQQILIKQGKHYSLSKKWVLELKSFFDNLLTSFDASKPVHSFSNELIKDNYASYTFNSLFDLDIFWGNILTYLADNIKSNEEKIAMNYGHYIWWMLINLGRETQIYNHYSKKNIKLYFLWFRDLPLNHFFSDIYSKMGHESLVKEQDVNPEIAFNTVGDTVVEVHYPKEIVKSLKNFFEKYSSLKEANMKEITDIVHKPCKIKLIIYKNKELAESINQRFLRYFKK